MKKTTLLGLYILYNCLACHAQIPEKKLYGIVIDAEAKAPVPFVHVITSRYGTVTNLDGRFAIHADDEDTLSFSHINYQQHSIPVTGSTEDSLEIFLFPEDILLEEITIRQLPSEEEFKKRVLRSRINPTQEQINADQNITNSKKLFLSGYVPLMNSKDNYKQYIQGPKGVSILASDPSKGLLKAFKNLSGPDIHSSSSQSRWTNSSGLIFRLKEDTTLQGNTIPE